MAVRAPLSLASDEPTRLAIQAYRVRYRVGRVEHESITHTSTGRPPVDEFVESALTKFHGRRARVGAIQRFR